MKWKVVLMVVLILVNLLIAIMWIPAGVVRLLGGKKEPPTTLQSSSVSPQPPPPPQPLPPPAPEIETPPPSPSSSPAPASTEKKEEAKEEEEKKPKAKKKEESKQKVSKQNNVKKEAPVKQEEPEEKAKKEDEPLLGQFGISCTKSGCVLFDLKSGRKLRVGDKVDGWTIKEVNLTEAILEKEGKRTVLRVE